MKFGGMHWKCIAWEFSMFFQFVPLIFTLAHLFDVFFTGEGASPLSRPELAVRIKITAQTFLMHFQCVPLIFTLADYVCTGSISFL